MFWLVRNFGKEDKRGKGSKMESGRDAEWRKWEMGQIHRQDDCERKGQQDLQVSRRSREWEGLSWNSRDAEGFVGYSYHRHVPQPSLPALTPLYMYDSHLKCRLNSQFQMLFTHKQAKVAAEMNGFRQQGRVIAVPSKVWMKKDQRIEGTLVCQQAVPQDRAPEVSNLGYVNPQTWPSQL